MLMGKPKCFDWMLPDVEFEERWEYREADEYPPEDASEGEIRAFMDDAKRAEKKIARELQNGGMTASEAKKQACQWPLRDDAPMEIIRDFISYQYDMQEAAKEGIDL